MRIKRVQVTSHVGRWKFLCGFIFPTLLVFQCSTCGVIETTSEIDSASENVSATKLHDIEKQNSERKCGGASGTIWRIIITGNLGYEDDLLTWWYHCTKAGLCPRVRPVDASKDRIHAKSGEDECHDGLTRDAEVIFYAEDVPIYERYKTSRIIEVKKAWEAGSKFNNTKITGNGRFGYSDKARFRHLVSRRPSILLQELIDAKAREEDVKVLFMDLDTFVLKDPRPYFVGDYDFWAADAMNEWSGPYNSGVVALKPSDASIQCIQRWRSYLEKQEQAKANQKTFNNIVRNMGDSIRHTILDPRLFPVGKIIIDLGESTISEASLGEEVVVFHNNFCGGTCSKPDRAKTLGLWHPVSPDELL